MKQYIYAEMDSPASLQDSLTDAVRCATVLRVTAGNEPNEPVVKLYMTAKKEFVTHWLNPELKLDDDVRSLLVRAKACLESDDSATPWLTFLYNALTNAAPRHESDVIGTPESRLRKLLESMPDESAYQALVRNMTGDWPPKRAKRPKTTVTNPNGYVNDVPFDTQVAKAMRFMKTPERLRYLIYGESDLKWGLSKEARDCLEKNCAVVWPDVRAMTDGQILEMNGMTLQIAAQVHARLEKESTRQNGGGT